MLKKSKYMEKFVTAPVAIEAESNEAKMRNNKADFFNSMKLLITLEMEQVLIIKGSLIVLVLYLEGIR